MAGWGYDASLMAQTVLVIAEAVLPRFAIELSHAAAGIDEARNARLLNSYLSKPFSL
ncbi:MAG TPA: hypothetical protein VGM09_25370 [Bradyrhizobium sp.]